MTSPAQFKYISLRVLLSRDLDLASQLYFINHIYYLYHARAINRYTENNANRREEKSNHKRSLTVNFNKGEIATGTCVDFDPYGRRHKGLFYFKAFQPLFP